MDSSRKIINSRQKGAAAERELANILKKHGYDARRGRQFNGMDGSPDVIGLPGIHIECKHVERLNIDKAMQQSIRDAKEGETPAVFHRKNRQPWKVTMLLDDWIELYKLAQLMKSFRQGHECSTEVNKSD